MSFMTKAEAEGGLKGDWEGCSSYEEQQDDWQEHVI
jgi:hypothetical protein